MGIRDYVASVRRGWVLVLLLSVVGASLGLLYSRLMPPSYTTQVQLFVSTSGSNDLATAVEGSQFTQQRVQSYAELLTGRELAQRIIDRQGLPLTPQDVQRDIQGSVVAGTVIIDVTVTSQSADTTYAIAQGLGPSFEDLVGKLEQAGTKSSPVQLTEVSPPVRPTAPSSPNPRNDIALGLVAGLLLGVVAAVARDRLDTSVRDEAAAAEASGSPVLALVPQDGAARRSPRTDVVTGPLDEAFQVLRTSLQFVAVDTKPRVLLVTSPSEDQGKTTTALHLAGALTRAGQRVLLVEVDLRRPGLTKRLGLVEGAGLTNVLVGTAELGDVLQALPGDQRLDILGAGPRPPSPSDLLSSQAMSDLLGTLTQQWDIVLLDAPPLLPVADAIGLSALVDGVVLCARWGETSENDVERSRALLDRAGARLLGVVLTFVPRRADSYSYGYGAVAEKARRRGVFRRRRAGSGPRPLPARQAAWEQS